MSRRDAFRALHSLIPYSNPKPVDAAATSADRKVTHPPYVASAQVLHEASVSNRSLPANFADPHLAVFEHELSRDIPATHLLELENVSISPLGILFRDDKVLPESFAHPHQVETWTTAKSRLKLQLASWLRAPLNKIDEDAFWVCDTQSSEYFHWMTDALPRLISVRDRLAEGVLLLPGDYQARPYVWESLRAFRIPRVLYLDRVSLCRRLLLPTPTAPSGNYNEALTRLLREQLTAFFAKIPVPDLGDRIYISRARAPRRKLHNESDVVHVLEKHGFQIVHFEDYTFEQQVALAAKTRFMVSMHGAGLTNMLFMPESGRVLELRKQDDAVRNCYFSLASALDLKYFYEMCEPDRPEASRFAADLIVDVESLDRTIQHMLEA